MDTNAILGPVAALALWSMVMWVWMYATRLPAMRRAKIDTANLVGGTGQNLESLLPPQGKHVLVRSLPVAGLGIITCIHSICLVC